MYGCTSLGGAGTHRRTPLVAALLLAMPLAVGCAGSVTRGAGEQVHPTPGATTSRPSTTPHAATPTPTPSGTPATTASATPSGTPSARPSATPSATPTPTRTATPTRTSATPPPGLVGTEWERIPTERRVVALTFDAGGDAAAVRPILDTLADRKVAATFFLTGAWARAYPDEARAIAAAQRVGNHSMTHRHFLDLTDAQIAGDLRAAAAAIREVCHADPAPLFRFPYGERDARTINAVNAAGYVPVRWTVDTLGWEGTREGITADSILARVLAGLRPGEIVLMHVGANPYDHSTLDADALPRLITALRARGYGFVSLDALLTAGS